MSLRRIASVVILTLVVGLLGHGISLAQANLVANPGFEEGAAPNGSPLGGWWTDVGSGYARIAVDNKIAHSGNASVCFSADSEARSLLIARMFAVAPKDNVHFEAWFRAEKLESKGNPTYIGLAFRNAAGAIIDTAVAFPKAITGTWSLVEGDATAPAAAAFAEIQLNLNHASGKLWFDDVRAVITSPLSFSLAEAAKPWVGDQKLITRVVNRSNTRFEGAIHAVVAKRESSTPVSIEPGTEKEVEIPASIPGVGTHDYALELRDASGKAVRAIAGKIQTRAPLTACAPCPCYHVVGQGDGMTRVDAEINLDPALRPGARLAIEISDASGKPLDSATVDASGGDFVGHDFRVPVDSKADYTVSLRLLDAGGKEIATGQTDIHVRRREESQVLVGPDGFLQIGGKPDFPIGLFMSSRSPEMAAAGFDATHNYSIAYADDTTPISRDDARLKTLLDDAYQNGMRMLVELPRKAVDHANWTQIRRRIETFRNHPGLLCWVEEERIARGEAPLSHLAGLYRIVKELDPNHPLLVGDSRDVIGRLQTYRKTFFPDQLMDVGIWWWYPIPLGRNSGGALEGQDASNVSFTPPSWLVTATTKKPLWIAVQSYQKPNKTARFPTPAEYRAMSYLSLIYGVKGLFFYTGAGEVDYQGKPSGILNRPEEGHWEYVKKLVREIRDFSPVIMSPVPAVELKKEPQEAPVDFTLRAYDGKLYLIAASRSGGKLSIGFTGEALAGKQVTVLHENRQVRVKNATLRDTFGPFAVHIYEIK